MKTTKLKDLNNMAFIPCFLFFAPKSLPFFYAFPFTVKKMDDFSQKLLLQKHARSHVWVSHPGAKLKNEMTRYWGSFGKSY